MLRTTSSTALALRDGRDVNERQISSSISSADIKPSTTTTTYKVSTLLVFSPAIDIRPLAVYALDLSSRLWWAVPEH